MIRKMLSGVQLASLGLKMPPVLCDGHCLNHAIAFGFAPFNLPDIGEFQASCGPSRTNCEHTQEGT
jgi:hypothetical protein